MTTVRQNKEIAVSNLENLDSQSEELTATHTAQDEQLDESIQLAVSNLELAESNLDVSQNAYDTALANDNKAKEKKF